MLGSQLFWLFAFVFELFVEFAPDLIDKAGCNKLYGFLVVNFCCFFFSMNWDCFNFSLHGW